MRRRLLTLVVVGLLTCAAAPAGAGSSVVSVGAEHSPVMAGSEPPGGFGKAAPGDGVVGQPVNLALFWGPAAGADSYEYCV
jgi:hypothetical protein